jgi:hypothetical protein
MIRTACLRPLALAIPLLPVAAWAQAHPYRISGTLLNSMQGTPIASGSISAESDRACGSSSATPAAVTSDARGHFSLALPCAGVWRLTASAQGFATQMFEQHGTLSTGVVLSAAQPAFDLTFRIAPNSSITGIVLDEAGERVRDAKVTLLALPAANDLEDSLPLSTTETDDRGAYEFPNLLPGDYQVAVHTQPWYTLALHGTRGFATPASAPAAADPSLDVTYPITYYPDVTDAHAATSLHLGGGADQQADIHLSPIPSIHLILPAGYRPNPDGPQFRRTVHAPPIRQISALGETDFEPTSVTLTDQGIDIGGLAPGEYVEMEPEFDRRERSFKESRFTIARGAPHAVDLASMPVSTSLVNPYDSHAAVPSARLLGSVLFEGKPASGAMLLLVSAAGGQRPGIHRQQSNTDGSFTFDHLNPGKYILVAIDHGWNTNWADPRMLAGYLMHGVPIALSGSTQLPQPVKAIAN